MKTVENMQNTESKYFGEEGSYKSQACIHIYKYKGENMVIDVFAPCLLIDTVDTYEKYNLLEVPGIDPDK